MESEYFNKSALLLENLVSYNRIQIRRGQMLLQSTRKVLLWQEQSTDI